MIVQNGSGNILFYPPIRANDLFSGVSENTRGRLKSMMQSKHFEPNQQVFAAGDTPSKIFLLNRGQANLVSGVRSHSSSADWPVACDQLFGITELLSGHGFEMSLWTVSACDFELVERDDFVRFLYEQPDVCFRLAGAIGSLYSEAVKCIKEH